MMLMSSHTAAAAYEHLDFVCSCVMTKLKIPYIKLRFDLGKLGLMHLQIAFL